MLDIVLLGCGGTAPLKNRWLTACYQKYMGRALLIDCGEGTQIAIKSAGVSLYAIEAICLTHYHADHVSGLPGLLLSMGLEGRTAPLSIYGPAGLERIIEGLRVIAPELPFSLSLHPFSSSEETFSVCGMNITAFAVKHTLPCYGYRTELPRAGKFDPKRARELDVPMAVWSKLQKETEASYNGIIYHQDMVLGAPRRGLSVSYCTDSRPTDSIRTYTSNTDLFICEGMYADPQKNHKAIETFHMTFTEAAQLAAEANTKALWLTHYSPSLPDPDAYLPLAQEIFSPTLCGFDGMRTTLRFEE